MPAPDDRLKFRAFSELERVKEQNKKSDRLVEKKRRREDLETKTETTTLVDNNPSETFLEAVSDTVPFSRSNKLVSRKKTASSVSPSTIENQTAVQQWPNAIDDERSLDVLFDLSFSDEHIGGVAKGINRKLLRKLRRGEFPTRSHIDLHGMSRKDAHIALEAFFRKCQQDNERCVLVVHGRGTHSPEKLPVLKTALEQWLAHGRLGRRVLAFCSARPGDGGTGAVYVLLRKY